MKDPAFLFYSQDFYSGTRLMLPIERACYVDLLIYQHQNGFIPNDLDRLLMFCSGVDKATLIATLKGKFKQCDKGWYNERLKNVIEDRQIFKSKLSISGKIGQFWKKAKSLLSTKEYRLIKDYIQNKDSDYLNLLLEKIDLKNESSLKGWLKASLKHIEIENEDENEDEDNIKEKVFIFEKFWDDYHLITKLPKTDKEQSEKYWNKLNNSEKEKAIENIKPYFDSLNDKKYCKKGRTYLSSKTFNDEFRIKPSYKITPPTENNPKRLEF